MRAKRDQGIDAAGRIGLGVGRDSPAAASTVWAVGDGAYAGSNDVVVTNLIAAEPADRLIYLGDVYDAGTAAEFANYYQPTYGRFKAITKPTPRQPRVAQPCHGLRPYWGTAYTSPHYYSFDSDGWTFAQPHSEEPFAKVDTWRWLKSDIAAHPGNRTVAYWHRPRYSAGSHGAPGRHRSARRALAATRTTEWALPRTHVLTARSTQVSPSSSSATGGKSLDPSTTATCAWPIQRDYDGSDPRLALHRRRADSPGAEYDGRRQLHAGLSLAASTIRARPPAARPSSCNANGCGCAAEREKLRVRFELSKAAKVELKLQRRVRGRYRKIDTRTLSGKAGANSVVLRRRSLPTGLIRITLVASDGTGNSSQATARLRVVR